MNRYDFLHLIKSLEETPERIRQLVRGLTGTELRRKPTDLDFSALEHACHLRDIEREGYVVRIKKLCYEECPFLPDIDGGKLADQRNYNSQDMDAALNEFSQARGESVSAVRDLPLDQLTRNGVLENVGSLTLGDLLLMILEHDNEHIRALTELRKSVAQ
jgi:hypothetical protein